MSNDTMSDMTSTTQTEKNSNLSKFKKHRRESHNKYYKNGNTYAQVRNLCTIYTNVIFSINVSLSIEFEFVI